MERNNHTLPGEGRAVTTNSERAGKGIRTNHRKKKARRSAPVNRLFEEEEIGPQPKLRISHLSTSVQAGAGCPTAILVLSCHLPSGEKEVKVRIGHQEKRKQVMPRRNM